MNADIEMTPCRTEYKGIVFDSKSEAVFARTLDIAGRSWQYHPAEHKGHCWDFCVQPNPRSDNDHWVKTTPKIYIEYKPKMPSATYVDELIKKLSSDPVESIIVFGNPWSRRKSLCYGDTVYHAYPLFSRYVSFGWGDFSRFWNHDSDECYSTVHSVWSMLGICEGMAERARRYRFDLTHTR